jgi:hypothetical protein
MTIGPLAATGQHQCDNCEWQGEAAELHPIENLFQRVEPGGVVPSGQCPKCAALAYPVVPAKRWLVVMYGSIDPGNAIGPVRDEAHEEELILGLMRESSGLGYDGEDLLIAVEVGEDGVPNVGSFSSGYIDGLRDQSNEEG